MSDKDLAGSSGPEPVREPDEPLEIFPVRFDKDFMDFRPVSEDATAPNPKGWSAQGSVELPSSVTGLEDVSDESLEENVQPNVAKASMKASPSVNGPQTSSKASSTGKSEQPAKA